MHIFGQLVHIFGELTHIFGKLVHIFARKLVSRTSKQVSKSLGPLWQPGVYNDTKRRGLKPPCNASLGLLSGAAPIYLHRGGGAERSRGSTGPCASLR